MDAVLKACQARGWTVAVPEDDRAGTLVNVDGGVVPVMLEERLGRKPRELTESEKEGDRLLDRKQRTYPVYTYFPNGELVLRLGVRAWKRQCCWRDTKRSRLETLLDTFISVLGEAGGWSRHIAECGAKAEERKREEDQRRWAEAQARYDEQQRVNQLLLDAAAWAKSHTLRAFIAARIAAMKAAGENMGEGSDAARWMRWATQQADRLDPLIKCPPSAHAPKPFTGEDLFRR